MFATILFRLDARDHSVLESADKNSQRNEPCLVWKICLGSRMTMNVLVSTGDLEKEKIGEKKKAKHL